MLSGYGWALSLGFGLSLFAYGSFDLYFVFHDVGLTGMSPDGIILNFVIAFATISWGLVFITRAIRNVMSKYPSINKLIVAGTASIAASVVSAYLSSANYLQYLEDRDGLERCNATLCFAGGKCNPMDYYHDFIIFSIADVILGAIGAALLFARWKDSRRNKSAVIIRKDDNDNA